MKQFNLEEYLKDPNRKIVTRDGRNVRIICTDKRGTNFPIVALVECEDKEETCYYTKRGYWNSCGVISKIDLFFAPEKHEGWVSIFNLDGDPQLGRIYKSKELAEEMTRKSGIGQYVTTIKIEWEE